MKPLSRSSTPSRIACAEPPGPDGAALPATVKLSVIGCKCMAPPRPRRVLHELSSQDLHMDDPAPCGDQGSATGELPSPGRAKGWEESENSRNRPVTTKATCSPMSTALSPTRSSAR